MNYPRHQQYRRLSCAGRLGLTTVPAAVLGLYLVAMGAGVPGTLVLALAAFGVVTGRRGHRLGGGGAGRRGVRGRDQDEGL